MNKLSLYLNIILLVAVAILFYFHFSKKTEAPVDTSNEASSPTTAISTSASSTIVSQAQKDAKIVFVNSDTLFTKYAFYKKIKDQSEASITALNNRYKQMGMALQQDYNDYVQKAGAGQYTKEQAEKIEGSFEKRKRELEGMEMQLPELQQKAAKEFEAVQVRMYSFFKTFSKAHGYTCILPYNTKGEGALGVDEQLDVTNVVVKGLNEDYQGGAK